MSIGYYILSLIPKPCWNLFLAQIYEPSPYLRRRKHKTAFLKNLPWTVLIILQALQALQHQGGWVAAMQLVKFHICNSFIKIQECAHLKSFKCSNTKMCISFDEKDPWNHIDNQHYSQTLYINIASFSIFEATPCSWLLWSLYFSDQYWKQQWWLWSWSDLHHLIADIWAAGPT